MSYDDIYHKPRKNVQRFCFDKEVVNVFDNMITRSVPGYQTIVQMISMMAEKYTQQNTCIYDLGCSLGTVSDAIRSKFDAPIIAVDSSLEMIECAKKNLSSYDNIEILCGDVCDIDITNASVIVMNFTMQFIPRQKREKLLRKIYNGLVPNGILILSEKIQENTNLLIDLHLNFKQDQGYSLLEIEQKKQALQNVMVIDSVEQHQQRLQKVGFCFNQLWFQCFNFVSFFSQKCK
ncbi:carboxy-S-adenosyl-L-methionine synthase CmoA [Candidatus Uabimicrobium sp. HlEnr_7]|uniref:carboxy-S-adenosyl-L-methionine synthase CmoA n=1 Tax=Candidatus Uabimicrobium helgolandensis TaxID=3095367 RepID=UPI00355734FD